MKRLKKIMSVCVAMIMALAMCVTAYATGTTPTGSYKITIDQASADHVYEAYQIFGGDLSTENNKKILSNIVWGNGVTSEGLSALGSAETKAASLRTVDDAANFAKEVASYLQNPTVSGIYDGENKKYEITGLSAGYYLVKDQDNTLSNKDDFYTAYIMEVVGDVTATPKGDKPTSEKKVKDVNDSDGSPVTGWQDSADYDIGDAVPFQLKGTVASNYDSYTKYKFVFHDKESEGLTFNNDVKVYIDNTKITSGFVVKTTNIEDGDTFEVVFDDLKTIRNPLVTAGSVITVEYTSTLNEEAVVGSGGNPNTMHLEYSNNPNNAQGGETGKTPDDTVIVFTYKTVVNKTKEDGTTALAGAEFKLEKFVADSAGDTTYENVKGKWVEKGLVKNSDGNIFTATGLDDGYYRLTETKAPEHYNQLKDAIYFAITATHDVTSDTPKLLTFSGENKSTGEIGRFEFTSDKDNGSISTNVVNRKGSTLPSTGGIGTTIFYIVGVVLVLGAGVLLVTKKRMNADK